MFTVYSVKAVFNGCTFNGGTHECIWSANYADPVNGQTSDTTFNNCTFVSDKYAINVYVDPKDVISETRKLTLDGCSFKNPNNSNYAAINIKSAYVNWDITIKNTKVNEFNHVVSKGDILKNQNEWAIKKIDGKPYTKVTINGNLEWPLTNP